MPAGPYNLQDVYQFMSDLGYDVESMSLIDLVLAYQLEHQLDGTDTTGQV